jgi:hypothetical protein
MDIQVLIERLPAHGFQASTGPPLLLSAHGDTQEAALQRLNVLLAERMAAGLSIVSVPVPSQPHPILQYAGTWKGHPLIEEWRKAVADYRKSVEEEEGR